MEQVPERVAPFLAPTPMLVTAGRIASKLRASELPAPDDSSDALLQVLPGQGIDPELDVRKNHARNSSGASPATQVADSLHCFPPQRLLPFKEWTPGTPTAAPGTETHDRLLRVSQSARLGRTAACEAEEEIEPQPR